VNMPVKTYKFCAQEGRALPKSVAGWFRGVGVQAGEVLYFLLLLTLYVPSFTSWCRSDETVELITPALPI
jgi:hypothetical protein